ncbi:hypothetical protein KEM09_00260 [Carboxylicivirga mesophila]|uniref:Helix-turn-helix type 11 domain-containing protein n=1 Tax=Carboxylicivirga mesophila TaxID=1166478 RepID=A0ABS5K462_9BACT|nr:hypothetical protein [Carboxylicivirga mesophila]MBS2209815.1 hypothetical protein [Carboxylicivirga mesophila]
MKLFEEVEMLKRMFELIHKRQTGNSSTFHKKLGISRSKLYNLIDDLKEKGIEVEYDKKIKSFYLKEDICVKVDEPIQIIDKEELEKINGGTLCYSIFLDKPMAIFDAAKTLSLNL